MATSTFLDSVTPWSSRAATPRSDKDAPEKRTPASSAQQGGDHRVNPRYRLSVREYPHDTPDLKTRWFFSETPKRKPSALTRPGERAKAPAPSKKFVSFSAQDSRSIETTFQRLADEEERREEGLKPTSDEGEVATSSHDRSTKNDYSQNTAIAADRRPGGSYSVLVPVNEDFLFDVDIDARELAPAYWLGPIYEVRRGTWFYQDGSSSRPCEENLAIQLEEGYVKTKPWRNHPHDLLRSASESRPQSTSRKAQEKDEANRSSETELLQTSPADENGVGKRRDSSGTSPQPKVQLQTHRLFGSYMNSVVTYEDATIAWLLTDDFLSRMSSSVYQRFAGGGHLGGIKVVRGFAEPSAVKTTNPGVVSSAHVNEGEIRGRSTSKREPPTPANEQHSPDAHGESEQIVDADSSLRRQELERRMESIVTSPGLPDPAAEEEEVKKRERAEIQEDYRDSSGDDQRRTIDHLVFVTHGIGQRLGLRMESLNFIHDVNVLRKTLKSVYGSSPDLQALNFDVDQLPKNCRIQVLPIVWRHLLDFPRPASGNQKREQDLSDANATVDDFSYPSLNDITIDGVPAIRNLVEDLFLDILLYQSAYRDHIADIIRRECNRVYNLFQARNPQFNGKVHFIGHSLGSAIMFDLLCWQRNTDISQSANQNVPPSRRTSYQRGRDDSRDTALDFEVGNFYCLGSPIGLFQMIKGRTICGRPPLESGAGREPWGPLSTGSISSPKCQQLFNIFHPTDPVAYRIEPLISPAMKNVKPQPLPYIKRGIFGAPGMGITGFGVRVGQSVSGLWSNITSGVANSLLNKSLGLTEPQSAPGQHKKQLSMAGAMEATGDVDATSHRGPDKGSQSTSDPLMTKTEDLPDQPGDSSDFKAETLYTGFKRRQSGGRPGDPGSESDKLEWQRAEDKARQRRVEESKIKGLNRNGRIDYSIQEGVFDISLIASLASHLSYWADEDVSHFVMSQLLSAHRSDEKRAIQTSSEA